MTKKWQTAEFGLISKRTGEIFDAELRIARKQGGKFMKLWQDTKWQDRIMSLQGNSLKVLFYLEMVAGWRNEVPGPVAISKALSIKRPHISRAYAELMKADLLCKAGGIYRLNPLLCWKGNDEQYEQACRELSSSITPQLVEAGR